VSIALLGSTGSIGVNTLNIAREFGIEVELLVAGRNVSLLKRQIEEFKPALVAVADKESAESLGYPGVLWGEDGILEALERCKSDTVVNALVGFLGLKPTLKALELNKRVALANKESLVVAGKFVDISKIVPIDSEHFALWYILRSKGRPVKMTITASGGAFRDRPLHELKNVSVSEALDHPNWKMGKKITVDSATMMNKIFELLEARWLFGCENLEAVIETKSIVHAIVEFVDGSSLLHAAYTDMRLPIAYAVAEDVDRRVVPPIDFSSLGTLEFKKIDPLRYPVWEIKDTVLARPQLGVVANAANEVAVEAFLKEEIGFLKISETVIDMLRIYENIEIDSIEEVFEVDAMTREYAKSLLGK